MKAKPEYRINYSDWKEKHKSYLEIFHDKRIILLYSGGKDSSLTLDFILKASIEFRFAFEAHTGAFPVHRYTDIEMKKINSYWEERGIEICWHDLEETDRALKDAENPCTLCQKVRKELLKTLLPQMVDDWERLILITSYSLWDIVSYSIEHIAADILSESTNEQSTPVTKRFIETAQRFFPLLKMKEGYSVFRPLIEYNGDDIVNYISGEQIPTISIPCLFKDFRPKRILEKYYKKMGLRFSYQHVLAFAKEALELPDTNFYNAMDKETYLKEIF